MRVILQLPDALVRQVVRYTGGPRTAAHVGQVAVAALAEYCPPQWRALGHLVEVVYYSPDLYDEPALVRHTFQADEPADDPDDRPTLVWDGRSLRVSGGAYYYAPGQGVVDSR